MLENISYGFLCLCLDILGGSWVVISGVTRPMIWVISVVTLLMTPLKTTHEPPSTCSIPSHCMHDPPEAIMSKLVLHLAFTKPADRRTAAKPGSEGGQVSPHVEGVLKMF